MNTIIYLIRHGDSPKTGEVERLRGISGKGQADAGRVTELLKEEGIDVFVSSPYKRAILTIEELASLSGKDVLLYEELKERVFSSGVNRMADAELYPLLEKSFKDPHYSLPGASRMPVVRCGPLRSSKSYCPVIKATKSPSVPTGQ